MWTYRGIQIHWLGHDSIVLKGSKTVIIDPFRAKGDYKADILLISHEHYDHLSEEDISRFIADSTTILAPKICEGPLKKYKAKKIFVDSASETEIEGVVVKTIPAYNIDKFRSPGLVFHPKEDGRVGFVVTIDGVRFYHAGDSDATQEMRAVDVDVSFLPVSGTYVMTAEEAAEAARAMKTKVAVPMHIESIIGTMADARRFKELVGMSPEVQILEKE